MSSTHPVDVDMASESDLSSLTGVTPSNPSDEPVEIRALLTAVDDAAYDIAYSQLPSSQRITIQGIKYAVFDNLRSKKAQKRAWYWEEKHAEELLRVTKGSTYSYLNT
jgi:hypothetical protein